jgi:HAD superfamily hydrolase (TIGR01484 family)
LCTDLDRTLLPNGPQPESPGARERFAHFVSRTGVTLAYVSGRHLELVEEAIAEYQVPIPDFAITDVGTKIYTRDGAWHVWTDWEEEIDLDWAGRDHAAMKGFFSDLDHLRLQEEQKQNTHKLSYYLPLDVDQGALDALMRERLRREGVRASLVWSIDEPAGVGLLDVLPERATKVHAVEFLRERLGIPLEWTLFSGDSGNDLPVMASRIPSVLVANASADVRDNALSQAQLVGHQEALYLANGGFLGMNGNYSAGILEGVVHYRPELAAWIEP